MKNFWRVGSCLLVSLLFFIVSTAQSEATMARDGKPTGQTISDKYIPGEVIVKFRENKVNLRSMASVNRARDFATVNNLGEKTKMSNENVILYNIDDGQNVSEKIQQIIKDSNVEYAEPNYKKTLLTINTDDTYSGLLWGLDNTGQTVDGVSGTSGSDISASEAWTTFSGKNNVVVSIIDTGVAYNHPDLLANMWDGSNCKNENGNFLGGCLHGYDFEDNDKTPLPTWSSHGTEVAGVAGAIGDNGKGIVGVNPQTKIMAIKFGLDVASEVKAIDFSIQNGAKIINASFGGDDFSQTEYDAINRFKSSGGIFIAAAGNDSSNNDGTSKEYPASYNLDNIISATSTDQNDGLASFANFGASTVDVGAPGVNIYSTNASEDAFNENFETITPPALPTGWAKTGNWGTFNLGGYDGTVLYGDLNYPYVDSADTKATSPTISLSGAKSAVLSFWTLCDTQYSPDEWTDYMALEVSADGKSFTQIGSWDEAYIDKITGDNNPNNYASYTFDEVIPAKYLTGKFKFRFHWVTDSSDHNYDGCSVDDIKIEKFSDGSDEKYAFQDGTSFSVPYVSGLAALLLSANTSVTSNDIKAAILNTGDALPSLSGKTLTGKRINAKNALTQIMSQYVMTPIASSAGGTFNSLQSITLSSLTSGADIYYTTDGSTPTASSTKYTGAFDILSNTTLNAIAIKTGMTDSDIMNEVYTINLQQASTPTASPKAGTYSSFQTVTLSTTTSGADIYYTTDGSTPTTSSTKYVNPITVFASQTIKAIAVGYGWTESKVLSVKYKIKLPQVKTPKASPKAGTYYSDQIITLSTTTSGADIYYTTDGSTPTISSTKYTDPIAVSTSQTIKAIAVEYSWIDSEVLSAEYTIKAVTPTASPKAGTYSSFQIVTLSTTTSGADIYYTTDGSTPTTSSTKYVNPITVSTSQTIRAIAVEYSWTDSKVLSAEYKINI